MKDVSKMSERELRAEVRMLRERLKKTQKVRDEYHVKFLKERDKCHSVVT